MKGTLDYQTTAIVNIFDEVNLWTAPFGRILLENIPMKAQAKVLDIGFGTGFPLVELSQRFGQTSMIYGMDIWAEAIVRTKEKINTLGLQNIELFEQSAEQIPLSDNSLDLICSNLGVNNFDNKNVVLKECWRVLKPNGQLCLATNPMGTFVELFDLFERLLEELNLKETQVAFQEYLAHRDTQISLENELSTLGFQLTKSVTDQTNIRFVNAQAVLDYGLIRIGFLPYWEQLIPQDHQVLFFNKLTQLIHQVITEQGAFKMTIPILYLEFTKV